MKIIQKAYRVWVHSMISDYPFNNPDDLEITYADNAAKAKYSISLYGEKDENGEYAKWIDIKCKRVKHFDKIEYNGEIMLLKQYHQKLKEEKRFNNIKKLNSNDNFYLQDGRSYVGNSVLWHRINGAGYTTDINQAHKYTKEELLKYFSKGLRETDIVWNAKHIESNIKTHIDMQYLEKEYSF